MAQPLSWKWKVLIAVGVLFLISIVFFFTGWGHATMKGWIDSAYEQTPPAERSYSSSADSYLRLAWFTGNICLNADTSQAIYRDFLAIDHPEFWKKAREGYEIPWKGKFDPNGKTGWGPLHPRAPEAFYYYMEIWASKGQSGQYEAEMAENYKLLFHDLYPTLTESGGQPHPRFYVYWEKIAQRYMDRNKRKRPPVEPKPAEYPGPECFDHPELLEPYKQKGM